LGLLHRGGNTGPDSNPFCDIPEPYHISLDELTKLDKAAFNAGNFACKLVNRLFPELFGPDHLRTTYSTTTNVFKAVSTESTLMTYI
jgi:hypothetical protein